MQRILAEVAELLFRDPELLEEIVKKPSSDIPAAVDGNRNPPAIGVAVDCVATPLAHLPETKSACRQGDFGGFSWQRLRVP